MRVAYAVLRKCCQACKDGRLLLRVIEKCSSSFIKLTSDVDEQDMCCVRCAQCCQTMALSQLLLLLRWLLSALDPKMGLPPVSLLWQLHRPSSPLQALAQILGQQTDPARLCRNTCAFVLWALAYMVAYMKMSATCSILTSSEHATQSGSCVTINALQHQWLLADRKLLLRHLLGS